MSGKVYIVEVTIRIEGGSGGHATPIELKRFNSLDEAIDLENMVTFDYMEDKSVEPIEIGTCEHVAQSHKND